MEIIDVTDIYNTEAEQSVIGAILMESSSIVKTIRSGLKAEHFYEEYYREIYKVMLKLYNEKKEIDILAVKTELEKGGIEVDTSFLTDIVTNTITTKNLDYYADIIKDFSTKRNIEEITRSLLVNMKNKSLDEMKREFELAVAYCSCKSDMKNIIKNLKIAENREKILKISTGFKELDKRLDRLHGGTLTVLAGDSGSGKSTLISQLLANIMFSGTSCFIYSGELTNKHVGEWMGRMIANDSDLKEVPTGYGSINYTVSKEAKYKINNWLEGKLYILSDEIKSDLDTIINSIEYSYERYGVKFFAIDNLMTITTNKSDKFDRQEQIVFRLKEVAKRLGVAILLVAHHKKGKQGTDGTPSMYDISGASEITNYADHIITIRRDLSIENRSVISITKNRTTGVLEKTIPIKFDSKRKRFFEYFDNELDFDYGYDKDICKENQIKIKADK
ncbi:DnaB-like helicase N-terminal domain-containing protein [Peptostreptococcus faecalis]|uniref:DnaB-like helicase N-terminal domain-containing protein n=1 Tax=Peptostreptococcus faecalis TaxID=2045015 RepID=UPI000C79E626|nr:DnaB-like helicase N-terminal domain-containing protein [Peptostreptococcus faecalis]